ncbi:c-type cytochrome [Citreimonas salinaria]|uniref:Cytochrome c553 n=1 Tax=Citreimonas salinaria TaxID=321339 RepID=A0A1H3H4Z4_9RHOB|nr:hypothetical protein [Citreimonas salinaria]SDY09988.1 Cytochrome c553 [Citreimonas salinaria]
MRATLAVAVLCIAGSLSAQEAPDFRTAPPGALSCSGCHGAGSDMTLSGLSAAEIESAMHAFKDGTREGTLMGRLAAGFDSAEIALIAAWIAEDGGTE